MIQRICLILLSLVVLLSCDDTIPVQTPDGRAYFPLVLGGVLEYRTDSIIFDDFGSGNIKDTLTGFVQERIESKFETSPGDTTYVIERYFKRNLEDEWTLSDVFSKAEEMDLALREENNLEQVKMRFPLTGNTKWDPTAFIDPFTEIEIGTETIEMFTNWHGSVLSIGNSTTLGAFQFEDVLETYLADDDNEIERRYLREIYAAGVGLVLRVDTILDSRCKRLGDLTPCIGEDWNVKGEKGYILRQETIAIK